MNAEVESARTTAWNNLNQPLEEERKQLLAIYSKLGEQVSDPDLVAASSDALKRVPTLQRRALATSAMKLYVGLISENPPAKPELLKFIKDYDQTNKGRYRKFLECEGARSALKCEPVDPVYSASSEHKDGREVIQSCFRHHLTHDPRLFIIGEDVGHLGGVNLEFEGLQQEFGDLAVTDTGIREASILGQGIGCAMRGLRPIVDIQYLDYVLYCFQVMSDDLATLHYRSAGGQIAPVIVRTKGHRLEGIWHTGSPIGTIVNGIRGMHFCVPRNMVQAAGMYNTLLQSDNPALVIEVLNGYRLKERVPDNLHEFRVGLGRPEVLLEGRDLTIVTYGACVRIAEEASKLLDKVGITVELIDVQTLLPFDLSGCIVESLQKTNAVLFFDEDVSGGGTAYMMQKILDEQNGNDFLDVTPRCLSAADNRSAYGSDGDYYCKPNAEQLFSLAYEMMRERDPRHFPNLW